MKIPAAASEDSDSAPMLKSTRWISERRALHSTIAVVAASTSAARGPKSAAPASEPTALTEIEPPSSTSIASAWPKPTRTTSAIRANTSWLEPKMIPRTPAAMPTNATRPTSSARRRGEREEARPVHGVRPRMPALLRRNQLDRGRKRLHVVAGLRHRGQAGLAVVRHSQRLGGGVEHAVPALELRAVDGEVGLVDQLVRVVAVTRIRGDADRDRRADRLARGLDVEGALGDLLADALRDLERLLRARLREEDAELLAAEARRDVVVAQLRAEDLRDALQHGVARRDGRTSC